MAVLERLPSLRGRRGTIVRTAYVVLAIFVSLISAGGLVSFAVGGFHDEPAAMRYGFAIYSDELRRPMVGKVWPEAAAAGFVEDAHIVAVDGTAIGTAGTQFTVGRLLRSAGPVAIIDLADDGGHVTRHRVSRIVDATSRVYATSGLSQRVFRWVRLANALLYVVGFTLLSLLLYERRPRDPEAMLLAFGFLLIGLTPGYDAWLITIGFRLDPATWDWLEYTANILGWWCMLFGLCAFPDGRFATRWSRVARLLPTTYLIVGMLTNWYLEQFEFAGVLVDVPIFAIVATSLLLRYRNLPSSAERQQLKWAALGAATMIAAAIVDPVMESPPVSARIGLAATYLASDLLGDVKSLAFPIGLLISLLRYRLYDADTVITRSAGYAGLTIMLVGVFACTEQLVQSLGQDYFGSSLGDFAGGLGAAAAAVMIAPLHSRINRWAERRFRKGLLHLRDDLPLLVGDLRETVTVHELAEAVLKRCDRSLHATGGAVIVGDALVDSYGIDTAALRVWIEEWTPPADHHLAVDPRDAMFPLHVPLAADGVGLVGWLLLGPRPDGSLYGKDEREVLAGIADPVARAIAISGRRATYQASVAARLHRLEAALIRLIPDLPPPSDNLGEMPV